MDLVFDSAKSLAKRESVIRHAFPSGSSRIISLDSSDLGNLATVLHCDFFEPERRVEVPDGGWPYDPDRIDISGRTLWLSELQIVNNK